MLDRSNTDNTERKQEMFFQNRKSTHLGQISARTFGKKCSSAIFCYRRNLENAFAIKTKVDNPAESGMRHRNSEKIISLQNLRAFLRETATWHLSFQSLELPSCEQEKFLSKERSFCQFSSHRVANDFFPVTDSDYLR